jgi:hypothetical protein
MPWARKRLHLTPRLEQQLARLSPRTIDYRLCLKKRQLKKRPYGRTRPGTLLKHPMPLKTTAGRSTHRVLLKSIWSRLPAAVPRETAATD